MKAVLSRARKGSTGFGHGVAVPHVKSPKVEKLLVAIGVSPEGIDFNALDKEPVYSLFLLLSPEDSPNDHLEAMEAMPGPRRLATKVPRRPLPSHRAPTLHKHP